MKRKKIFIPTDDSTIRDGNYVNNTHGHLNYFVVKSDAIGYARKAYIRFDLSNLNESYIRAKLNLFAKAIQRAPTRTIDVYLTSTDWDETTLTWNNAPALGDKIASLEIKNTTGAKDDTGYWFEFDLTRFIGPNMDAISLALVDNGPHASGSDVTFSSKEGITNWPNLTFELGTPVEIENMTLD